MTAFLALVQREYWEHRGAFFYAPLILLGIFAFAGLAGSLGAHGYFGKSGLELFAPTKFFEIGYGAFVLLWWLYLLGALFFYVADAFSADRRNNAMLFWKSMPQSDFKILGAKFAAGGTLFPALVFLALLITGLLVMVVAAIVSLRMGRPLPDFAGMLGVYGGLSLFALIYFALGLLWYAPFFAWVGGLSTLVGRWSIPLAFLVPGIAILMENVAFRGAPYEGGYIWHFLSMRMDYGFDRSFVMTAMLNPRLLDPMDLLTALFLRIDWPLMVGGWVFALAAIWLASEYRRRTIDN